jgi:hypothetical protein
MLRNETVSGLARLREVWEFSNIVESIDWLCTCW